MSLRIPNRFAEAHLSQLDKKVFSEVIRYSEDTARHVGRGIGLFLSGPPGVGKTYAIAALTREFSLKDVRGDYEFVTAPDFFERINPMTPGEDNYRGQTWLDTYTRVPWLVINDLGKEYRGGKYAEQASYLLGRVLRARSERVRVTHITTNIDGKSMKGTYGESIVSLISEMTIPCICSGPDRRNSKA